jgi:hypothetical protein
MTESASTGSPSAVVAFPRSAHHNRAMTTMIAEVYDAFVAAGTPEDKARRAAEAVAAYENRFASLEQRLIKMDGDISQRFAKVDGEIRLLSWMIGFNLAASIGIIFMLLRH